MTLSIKEQQIECGSLYVAHGGKIVFGDSDVVLAHTTGNVAITGMTLDPTVTAQPKPGGDRLIHGLITQSTSAALTGTLDGIYMRATGGDTGGAGTIRGAEIGARLNDSVTGAVAAVVTGGYFWADAKTKEATILRGVEVSLDGGAGGTTTTAQGVVIFNNSSAVQTTSIGVDINGGTPSGHKAFTYDIRLQNGEIIDNATDGVVAFSAAQVTVNSESVALNHRHRVTTAEMNAGHTILAAVTGMKYRLIDFSVIAIGGNAAATADATGVAIYGTQSAGSATLFEVHLNELTRSTVNKPNTTNTHVLADGASFIQNDAATAITVKSVSAGNFDIITATHFDIILTYALEV